MLVGASRQRAAPRSQFCGHGAGAPFKGKRRRGVLGLQVYRTKSLVLGIAPEMPCSSTTSVYSAQAHLQESQLRSSSVARLIVSKYQHLQIGSSADIFKLLDAPHLNCATDFLGGVFVGSGH